MGIIKQGILGGFSGKVAGVVGTSWKGRAIMKALPLSVANPRTTDQVAQRTSFKKVSSVGSAILTKICRNVYNPIAGDISGFNKYTSKNKQMFDGAGAFQFAQTTIGGGTLQHDQLDDITLHADEVRLDANWDMPVTTPAAREGDEAFAYAIEPISGNIWVAGHERTRSDEHQTLELAKAGSDLIGQLQVYGYVAFVDPSGRQVSIEASGFQKQVDFGA